MKKLTTKKGKVFQFEPLVYNEKNITKVLLSDNDDNREGIWIVVSDKDKKDLDADKASGYFVAMLANDALHFYPNSSWGLHILCRHKGKDRAVSNINWIDYGNENNRIFSPDVPK